MYIYNTLSFKEQPTISKISTLFKTMLKCNSFSQGQIYKSHNSKTKKQQIQTYRIAEGVHVRPLSGDGVTIIFVHVGLFSHQTASSHTHIIGCVICARRSISYPLGLPHIETIPDGPTGQLTLLLQTHCERKTDKNLIQWYFTLDLLRCNNFPLYLI